MGENYEPLGPSLEAGGNPLPHMPSPIQQKPELPQNFPVEPVQPPKKVKCLKTL